MTATPLEWHNEGAWSYCVAINHGESRPTFLVLGKRPAEDRPRPVLCSGYVKIADKPLTRTGLPKLDIVINEGVLPSVVERRILDDVRAGRITGPKAARGRWHILMGTSLLEGIARLS